MRELTDIEISVLEEQGCTAEDWTEVLVDDDFNTATIYNVACYGHVEIGSMVGTVEIENGFVRRCGIRNAVLRDVRIGDGCLIENVRGYISNYDIGDQCYISDVGIIATQGETNFGNGNIISVLNEGGDGNVVIYDGLTAQLACLMLNNKRVRDMAMAEAAEHNPAEHGQISDRTRIIGTKEITNTVIGRACEVQGASRISNSTLLSTDDAPTYIGTDAIIDSTVVANSATITGGAKLTHCFVGESVHIGKGFSAEASVFFANSYMDNGEACAAFCGPFSTSHHKSTLLIGGMFSFYNAGSGTNQSNHAYKMGPIHWGTLQRGAKTASGCHILWPANIGAFSMAMGKIATHPDTSLMPFSYLIASGDATTYLVPGVNLRTVGTWRDVGKWPKRDIRPLSARRDIIDFAFPNPYIVQAAVQGKNELQHLLDENCDNQVEYEYGNCIIKKESILRGIRLYDIIIRLFIHNILKDSTVPQSNTDVATCGEWLDLSGMLTPKCEIDRLEADIESGAIGTTEEILSILRLIHRDYQRNATTYATALMQNESDSLFVDEDYWRKEGEEAHALWLNMVCKDAEKEYEMGDVEEQQLREFLEKVK